jgi:NADPH:quinone reductase-like Zn-dependent oxidoreductase
MNTWLLVSGEGPSTLVRVERPAPALAPREVRVRVHAVSLNFRDLGVRNRVASGELAGPRVPCSDGAGEVVEVGPGVTRFAAGDRVAANFFPTWIDGPLSDAAHAAALGGTVDGMLSEEVLLHEDAIVAVPAHLSYEEAATLPCAAVTAWHALFEVATVRPGDVVLVQGTGGVSLFALQLARLAGADVIATSSSAAKAERARALGASHVIDYRANPQWGAEVRRLTGGRGADVVVEVGGPGTLDQSVEALRYGGTIALIGVLTGRGGPVNTAAVFSRAARIAGIYVGSRRMFESLNRAIAARTLHPVIDATFDFDDAPKAYAHLQGATHFGKVVIRVR